MVSDEGDPALGGHVGRGAARARGLAPRRPPRTTPSWCSRGSRPSTTRPTSRPAASPTRTSGEHNTLDSILVRIREGVEWLWELPDGTVAHLTGSGLPSYGVARIGPVYTPREFRGRGIASYVVGELTRRGLEAGTRMCLFTDRANPTSNKIYAGLGYEPVVDMAEHLVTVPSRP